MFDSVFGKKPQQPHHKGGPLTWEPKRLSPLGLKNSKDRPATFSKVIRWRLPDGQTQAPKKIEVAGSFTHWRKVPLTRDSALDAWHVTLHQIPSHQTHHYVLLIDGKPAQDKFSDGLAVPHGPQEEQFAFPTDRGPRVCMLFAQTK
jgi:hypothetical protein